MCWQVQEFGGNMVRLSNFILFQRAINFVGHKDMSDYTAC